MMEVGTNSARPGDVKVIPFDAICDAVTPESVIAAVRGGFVAHARRRVSQAPATHLAFHDADGRLVGDCHLKWGHDRASEFFVIKVATGFYDNPNHSLPSSDGLMLLVSARTGAPGALLEDRGWLTDARTAAAGALAVEAAGLERVGTLGVLGTGTQANLQARWIAAHRPVGRVLIWGRRADAAEMLAADLRSDSIDAVSEVDAASVATKSDVLVTTTPSSEPLLMNGDVQDGSVIVAVGADTRGKREFDPALLRRAERIICDDPGQCLDHGELQYGGIDPGRLERLGDLLASRPDARPRRASGVTIVDLTGIAAQDVAVAQACWADMHNDRASLTTPNVR